MAIALALSAAPNRAASDEAKPAPDAAMVAAHAAAKGDGLLEALLTELDRSKAQLKMEQVQGPYYVEYRVNEVEDFAAEAAFGALRENQHVHVRVLRVVVRIGDYRQDSYFSRGQGESNILPLDDDPIALRHQLWLATDDAYKNAGQALAEKQAAMKQFSVDPSPVDDFAKAPPVIAVEPIVSLKFDETGWKKTLEDVTGLYKQYPDVQSVTASARFSAINEYLVNSEGTVTRNGKVTYNVQLSSAAQAADGMRLGRSPGFMVARPEELPTHDGLMGEAKKMLETVVALRQAPIVEEEYRGPVLFAADAADDIVASLIGRKEPGGKLCRGQRRRESTSRQCRRRRNADKLSGGPAAHSRLPRLEWAWPGRTGRTSRAEPGRPAGEKLRSAIRRAVEEESRADGDGSGQAVWLSRGDARSGQFAAATLSGVCERWA